MKHATVVLRRTVNLTVDELL